jgi:5-methyltetrahydrofolate--homocysteine methyltransferase
VTHALADLLSPERRERRVAELKAEQQVLRERHEASRRETVLLKIADARAKKAPIDWATTEIATPRWTGVRAVEVPLEEIAPLIDWSPFFWTWELRGLYPSILEHAKWGEGARALWADAQAMLQRILKEKRFRARAVVGYFPANAVGDDVELYGDAGASARLATLRFLRQQRAKTPGSEGADEYLALADFVAPQASGRRDYVGAFVVTSGGEVEAFADAFAAEGDDYSSILVKALGDRFAEALAERMHQKMRADFGFPDPASLTIDDLIKERYRGIRPAPGYPACPDHTEKLTIFRLLGAEAAVGVALTEGLAMRPASSVSGLYFAHPASRYFRVGQLGKDQVEDYAARKGAPLEEVEKWLAPYLAYDSPRARPGGASAEGDGSPGAGDGDAADASGALASLASGATAGAEAAP